MKYKYVFFLAFILLFSACEKIFIEPDKASHDPFVNFDYLWNEVDKKYSYFELKNIDWNDLKVSYQKKLYTSMTQEELFDVLADLLKELRDDHTNLFSSFNVSRYNLPLQKNLNFHARTLSEFYIPNAMITGPFVHDFLQNGNVGYVRYSSFMSAFSKTDLDYVLKRYENTRGLILDVRENGGGNMFYIMPLLERFVSQRTLVAYSITRNGVRHHDFSEPAPMYVNPYDGEVFLKPVIVLIDRGSYSATTFFSLCTKALPNVTLLGDTTGGGGGMPNGGQLPNGWTYRFSITQLLDVNKNAYAESGVPPEISASFDWNDLTKDELLEKAIMEINHMFGK